MGKRKRKQFYAVRRGFTVGIFEDWDECAKSVQGYSRAEYKGFQTYTEAHVYLTSVSPEEAAVMESPPGSRRPSQDPDSPAPKRPRHGLHEGSVPFAYAAGGHLDDAYDRWPPPASSPYAYAYAPPLQSGPPAPPWGPDYGAPAADVGAGAGHDDVDYFDGLTDSAVNEYLDHYYEAPSEETFFSTGSTSGAPRRANSRREGKRSTILIDDPVPLPMMPDPDGTICVWTDGACVNNGKAGARAGYGAFFGEGDPRNISQKLLGPAQTNQRAEVKAVIEALDRCPDDRPVTIYTDSKYTLKGATQWMPKWRKKKFKTSTGEDVKNLDLFLALDQRLSRRSAPTRWVYVKGHSGDPGNDAADRLAVAGAWM